MSKSTDLSAWEGCFRLRRYETFQFIFSNAFLTVYVKMPTTTLTAVYVRLSRKIKLTWFTANWAIQKRLLKFTISRPIPINWRISVSPLIHRYACCCS